MGFSSVGPQGPATAVLGGATLPPSPTSRQVFLKNSGGSEGLYICISDGTWVMLEAASGAGTVTSVSVVSANGFSASVANPTTTPAITINNPTALVATTSVTTPQATLGTVSTTTGSLRLANASTANLTTLQAGNAASALTFVWPVVNPTSGQALLASAPSGSTVTLSWGAAGITNAAGANVLTKSDGTNLVASALTDNATNILSTEPIAVGFGATAPPSGPMLMVASTVSTSPRGILSAQFSTDTSGARVGFQKARGSVASPTTVVTGDTLGRLMFRGYDGTSYLEMGSIEVAATGTIGTNRVPTQLVFSTATDAATSVLTTALTIGADQKSTFGGSVMLPAGTAAAPSITLGGDTGTGWYRSGASTWAWASATNKYVRIDGNFVLAADTQLAWSSTAGDATATRDTFMVRNAAANLQLGAASGSGAAVAQTFSVQGSSGASAAPALFTITGSDQTGTTTTGGELRLRGGNGTTAGGAVTIYTSATSTPTLQFKVDSNGVVGIRGTDTAAGTTGAQTINKPSGTVNFGAAASSLVVTNSLVTTSTKIQCTVQTNDTTMKSVQCVAGSGSFTIFSNAAATAETQVYWELRSIQ